jgi:outer membrane protein assembly factor BamB
MAETSEFQLEHDLDAWWDRATANGHSLADPEPLRADIATVRYLSSHHIVPNPDPAFVRVLKDELMKRSVVPNGVTTMPVTFSANGAQSSVATRVRNTFWPEQRRRLWGLIELATAAVLILAFLGTAFGGGPFNDLHSLWPQTTKQTEGDPTGMYRGNAARTGVSSDSGPRGQPALQWKQRFHSPGNQEAAVAEDGRIYLAQDQRGEVIAVDTATGKLIWTAKVGKIAGSAPAVGDDTVYVATAGKHITNGGDEGYLVALDAATGAEKWRYQTGGSANSSPAIDGDTVYVTTVDQILVAADAQSGQEKWRVELPHHPADPTYAGVLAQAVASATVANGVVYVSNFDGILFAIDATDGHELWRFQTLGNVVYTPAIVDSAAYFTAAKTSETSPGKGGWVYAVDTATGTERWSIEAVGLSHSAPAVAEDLVFLGSTGAGDVNATNASFTALDARDGHTVWTHETGSLFTSNLTYAQGVVYATTSFGGIFALDAQSGDQIWRADVNPAPTNNQFYVPLLELSVTDGLVIVPAADGAVYAIGNALPGATPGEIPGTLLISACIPPRTLPSIEIAGTPSATLISGRESESGGLPEILPNEIPHGDSPSTVDSEGIQETLSGMAACDGDWEALLSYYSDDFLRRAWIGSQSGHGGYYAGAGAIHDAYSKPVPGFVDARVLPDGRIGVVFHTNDLDGWFVIFAEQDGRWLIDERYRIVEVLNAVG